MTQQNPFTRQPRQQQPGQINEFDLMRKRLKNRGATTGQERQQELSRQFASLGNLPSGAAIKTRQNAATASERATNEAIQDVNILEAQTNRQERESEAQRGLQRELQANQIGFQEREGAATRTAQFDIATLGAETDLEKARMAGANAIELQNLRNEAAIKERGLIEAGLNERQASVLSQNKKLFDLEMEFKKQGQSFAEQAFKDEHTLNKSVTAIHAIDLLRANGFDHNDVSGLLMALGIPHADTITDFLMRGATGAEPTPTQPAGQTPAQVGTQEVRASGSTNGRERPNSRWALPLP